MTDLISFYASKIFWALLAPSHVLVILFALSYFMRDTARHIVQGCVLLCFLAAMMLPLGEWMALPLEECFIETAPPMQKVDGFIILGGALDSRLSAERRAPVFTSAAGRVMALTKLMHDYPNATAIYSGGSGSIKDPDFDEATMVKNYLNESGFDASKIVAETHSHNTYENALNSLQLIGQQPDQHWLLVTSAMHLPRAMALFQHAGNARHITFSPYPVAFVTPGWFRFDSVFDLPDTLGMIDNATKEYLGLVINKLLGKADTFWPCTPPSAPHL